VLDKKCFTRYDMYKFFLKVKIEYVHSMNIID
jgi:hypothetical protein